MHYAYKLSNELASYGFQIISGLARGIDVIAHKGAIDSNGRTYGILGCGVDRCYPNENIDTFMKTIENGGIMWKKLKYILLKRLIHVFYIIY